MATKSKSTKPQTTLVTVAVTTAGPVSMTWVREWVRYCVDDEVQQAGTSVTRVTVKRDANRER